MTSSRFDFPLPTDRFAEFWSNLVPLLRPGGRVLFVDESPARNHEDFVDAELVERCTNDGVVHRAVKVFWSPDELQRALRQIGSLATVEVAEQDWIVGAATPLGC